MRILTIFSLVAAVVVAVDIGIECTEREREAAARRLDSQVREAREDRQYGQLFAGIVVAVAIGWVAASFVPSGRWQAPVRLVVGWSCWTTITCGLTLMIANGIRYWATAKDGEPYGRNNWESVRLIGSVLGAVFGTAIGSGLALIRYVPHKKPRTAAPSQTG